MISVIIPTVKGRERSLDRTVKAYQETWDDIEILVYPNDGKPCGEAWIEGAKEASGDYLHWTADDIVPHPGWAEAAMDCCDQGKLPAATVYGVASENFPGGVMSTIVYLLPKLPDVPNVLVPFLSREQFSEGGWLLPIHYGTDDWVTYVGRMRGFDVVRLDAFAFDHYAEMAERQESRRVDVPALVEAMSAYGYVPMVYLESALAFGWSGFVSEDAARALGAIGKSYSYEEAESMGLA